MLRIADFTEEERMKIDGMLKRGLQGLTADEVALYSRWTTANELDQAEYQETMAAITANAALLQSNALAMYNNAIASLEAQRDAALAWYDSLIGGDDDGEES